MAEQPQPLCLPAGCGGAPRPPTTSVEGRGRACRTSEEAGGGRSGPGGPRGGRSTRRAGGRGPWPAGTKTRHQGRRRPGLNRGGRIPRMRRGVDPPRCRSGAGEAGSGGEPKGCQGEGEKRERRERENWRRGRDARRPLWRRRRWPPPPAAEDGGGGGRAGQLERVAAGSGESPLSRPQGTTRGKGKIYPLYCRILILIEVYLQSRLRVFHVSQIICDTAQELLVQVKPKIV